MRGCARSAARRRWRRCKREVGTGSIGRAATMLRCKVSYVDICAIEDLKLVGNSLVCWPASLKNCKRLPHPLRESKPFLRDKILCKESSGHIGNVQNNLALGLYKGKHVALLRASDCVLDCGQGTIVDFPSWKALRDMLATQKAEVELSVSMLLAVANAAEEEVEAGLAEEVVQADTLPEQDAGEKRVSEPAVPEGGAGLAGPPAKRARTAQEVTPLDLDAWLASDLGEYPSAIRLVSSSSGEAFGQLLQEANTATLLAYDAQWSPDFDEGTDNPIAILQLAFPNSGNTYVLQLPLLDFGLPKQVQRLFESPEVIKVGFAANDTDVHKFEVSGVKISTSSLLDVQPWCEAEMGENNSVKQGWRVGLKRASWCVLDFEMDKTSTVASSNWEREELTTAQVEYGAMDVWVALRLYQRLARAYGK